METSSSYVFFFRATNQFEFYTQITFSEITSFLEDSVDIDDVMLNFYNAYLSDCVEVEYQNPINGVFISIEPEQSEQIGKTIEAGDVETEDDDYATFYLNQVEKWKSKVLNGLDFIEVEKMYDPQFQKTFGQFLQSTLNAINARPFLQKIKVFIKKSMTEGLRSAEEETELDIGVTPLFEQKLQALEYQQFNGYTIHGKRWYGIRGASQEMQQRILAQVAEDVRNKVSKKDMAQHITEIFDGIGQSQAKRIATT
jgi:hypothetical protein